MAKKRQPKIVDVVPDDFVNEVDGIAETVKEFACEFEPIESERLVSWPTPRYVGPGGSGLLVVRVESVK